MQLRKLAGDLWAVVRYHFRPTGDEGTATAIRLVHMYQRARLLEEMGIEEPGLMVARSLDEFDLMYR